MRLACLALLFAGLGVKSEAGLLDFIFGNNGSATPQPTSPPVNQLPKASDIIVTPRPGETIEILYVDDGAGLVYYKATGSGYQRAAFLNVLGYGEDIVHDATKLYYSASEWKLYWSTGDTIETIFLNGTSHEILAQNPGYLPNAFKWVWLNEEDAWVWNRETSSWHYLLGNPVAMDPLLGTWETLLQKDWKGWIWFGDYPWVYLPKLNKWYYMVGDLWSYSDATQTWRRVENNKALKVGGTLGNNHFEEENRMLYYQLDPPTETGRVFGSIQKMDIRTKAVSTAVEMTNALEITSLPQLGELYWSENDGIHAATSQNQARRVLLRTPLPGNPLPILYEEPSPSSTGTLYNLEIANYSPAYQHITVDFLPGNKFKMGYSNNFLSGTYTWTKTGTHNALLQLAVQGEVTIFAKGSSTPLDAKSVQEAYLKTSGSQRVDLPQNISIQLSFRDSMQGETRATETLASNNIQVMTGKFSATGGDYSGIPRVFPLPPSLPGATVQSLVPLKDLNQIQAYLLDAGGNPIQETLDP
jgi:hypothetical protein